MIKIPHDKDPLHFNNDLIDIILYFHLGLEILDGLLPPTERKLAFIAVWFSAGFSLLLVNR